MRFQTGERRTLLKAGEHGGRINATEKTASDASATVPSGGASYVILYFFVIF